MRSSAELSYEENVQDARRLRLMLRRSTSAGAGGRPRARPCARRWGGLVACADIAVAAEETGFAFSEVKLGIVPSVISPFALAKIGPSAARRYFVTGERFDADTAFRIGLVHEVAEDRTPWSSSWWTSSSAQARRRHATRSGSCSTGRTASRPSVASPSVARARRARKASARS